MIYSCNLYHVLTMEAWYGFLDSRNKKKAALMLINVFLPYWLEDVMYIGALGVSVFHNGFRLFWVWEQLILGMTSMDSGDGCDHLGAG